MPKLSEQRNAQTRWAARQMAAGNCRICGKPRTKYKWLCDAHQAHTTAYMRRWRAAKRAAKAASQPEAANAPTSTNAI